MSTPNPMMARVAGTVAALALIAIATIGVFIDRSGSDASVAGPTAVTTSQAPQVDATAPVAPIASVEIVAEPTGPRIDPFTGVVVLAAYTDLTPAEWADGVLAGFAPEPTAVPVAPTPVAVAPTPAPVPVEAPAAPASTATQSAVAPTPTTAVQAAPFDGPIVAESVGPAPAVATDGWAALRNCESGGNYTINTGNGFYGAYQFTIGTWNAVAEIIDPTYVGVRPDLAPPAAQDRMASALRYEIAWGGWQHWPICGRYIR